jgi:hypothetical protein
MRTEVGDQGGRPVFAFAFWLLGMSFRLLRAIIRQELAYMAARPDNDFSIHPHASPVYP